MGFAALNPPLMLAIRLALPVTAIPQSRHPPLYPTRHLLLKVFTPNGLPFFRPFAYRGDLPPAYPLVEQRHIRMISSTPTPWFRTHSLGRLDK